MGAGLHKKEKMAQVKKHAKIRDRISECSLFSKSYVKFEVIFYLLAC